MAAKIIGLVIGILVLAAGVYYLGKEKNTKALHRHRPHVLLLDFLLPHKGGFHVMQHRASL